MGLESLLAVVLASVLAGKLHTQMMATHEPPRPTKLYDRTNNAITLAEVERIAF